VVEWVASAPDKHWLTGLQLKNRRRFSLTADRCERCGFLEFYA
jgi:hypothetical protein